ncbi:MAG: hypothetical protein R2736_12850 [Solirubrobacterales bacterium]
MDVLALLAILALLLLVVAAVSAPLRRRSVDATQERDRTRRDEPEAARERSTARSATPSLDHQTGKLSEADWRGLDRQLRAEAAETLRQLDEVTD